jgi:hypothetical protein
VKVLRRRKEERGERENLNRNISSLREGKQDLQPVYRDERVKRSLEQQNRSEY